MDKKQCRICGQIFPSTPENFYRHNGAADGLRGECKACHNKQRREYYEQNRDEILEKAKTYRHENVNSIKASKQKYYEENKEAISRAKRAHYLGNKEKYKEQFRAYRERNREKLLAKDRAYNKENRERRREYERGYYSINKDKLRGKHNRRRSRRNGLEATLTAEQWERICEVFNHECAYCGHVTDLEQEHFVPLVQGGGYTESNIIPACRSCNASKNDKDFFEWYPQQDFYSQARQDRILQHLGYGGNEQSANTC